MQDQAYGFGHDASRLTTISVLLKTRNGAAGQNHHDALHSLHALCQVFTQEVAGVPEIGAIGRGEDMEITTYLEASLDRDCRAM